MLSYRIALRSDPTNKTKQKQVSEFAWKRKYEKMGIYDIVDQSGKAAGADKLPDLPPTQFAPPKVVELRAPQKQVAPSAEQSEKPVVDPTGATEVAIAEAVVDSPATPIPAQPVKAAPPQPVKRKPGRPAKVRA
jgi:hypothetical protein